MVRVQETLKLALSLGASVGALCVASSAFAADATAAKPDSSTVQEVVVTGFRSSLAKAISEKRHENSQVDAILAEDIGKFPDLNLAESLQRIPGVSITREGGEGRQITVRGLGPQYTRTRINGMEALTTIGSPDNNGGVNRTRSFDFNVFASDLFSNLVVHKTAEGSIDEGSLGATIDLHSARPFDYKGRTLIIAAKADHNDLAGTTTPRMSAIVSDISEDGTFGILASVSYSKRKFNDVGFSTVRWDLGSVLSTGGTTTAPLSGFGNVLGTNCRVYPIPAACAASNAAFHPRFPRYDLYKDNQDRFGATFSIQLKPSENHQYSIDFLHSRWNATRLESYIEAPGFSGTGACSSPLTCTSIANISILSQTINNNGVMVAGTFNGVDVRAENRFDKMNTKFDQLTLEMNDRYSPTIWGVTTLGINNSEFHNPVQTTVGFDQYNVQGFSYDFSNRDRPVLNFGSANLTSSGPWVLTGVRMRPQSVINNFQTFTETLHWDFHPNLKFSGGFSYKGYVYKTSSLRLVNGESVTATNAYAALRSTPIASLGRVYNGSSAGIDIPAGAPSTWFGPSVSAAESVLNMTPYNPLFAVSNLADLGNNAEVKEKDTGVFAQADFETQVFGKALRGNAGMRGVHTNQFSAGYTFIGGVLQPVSAVHNYDAGLPSVNFVYELRDDAQIRFGASRVMTRPDLGSLVSATSVTVSGTSYTVKTGNPNLKPFLANAYDVAFEWYPSRGAILSIAGFRKDVITLVTSSVRNIPFSGNPFGVPDSAAIAACGSTPGCSPQANWAFSAPVNTHGGHIVGMEINYQQPFTFLPGLLRHTGVLLNYTAVNSRVNYTSGATTVQGQLLGLSRGAANATLYYEDDKWSARLTESTRTKYLQKVPGTEVGTNADGVNGTTNLDLSIQYTLSSKLKFSFEGVNLTNEQQDQFTDTTKNMPYYVHKTGTEFLFGFRYQL